MHASPQTLHAVFIRCGLASHPDRQWPRTVSWAPSDYSGVHHPLSPVIKLGLRYQRHKKKSNNGIGGSMKQAHFWISKLSDFLFA